MHRKKKSSSARRNPKVRKIMRFAGERSIVMVGLMGAGKTSVGRRLAVKLGVPFLDADAEIEKAAGKSIPEIFADHGEESFRSGESKVISRLLECGPQVLATGGGAFMNAETRGNVAENGISVWLRAELPLLLQRVARRSNRPLLHGKDPETVMRALMDERYPVYELADITVESRDVPHDAIVADTIAALARFADAGPENPE